ncbi:MAG: response regulator, partial [Deltaproteobacteria bacterium]|nr:response regulator [Deltaproteobacteria bacterium]
MTARDPSYGGRELLDSMLRTSLGAWIALGVAYLVLGRPFGSAVHFAVVAATAWCGWYARRWPGRWRLAAHTALAVGILGFVAISGLNGGLVGASWWVLGLAPLFAANAFGRRATVVWAVVLVGVVVAVAFVPWPAPRAELADVERAIAGTAFVVTAASFVLVARRRFVEQIDTITARERTIAEQSVALDEAREHLEDARDRAMAASRAKSEFLATMSHELRTPLNGILGLGGVLLESRLERDQRELVATLVASAEAQRRLLDDALDLARIEAGRLELAPEPFAVRDCIEDVADLFSGRASEKSIELTVVLDPSLPAVVRSDGLRVRQVVSNLLSNAVKFTDQGSVTVRARALDADPAAGGRTTLEVVVEDTGPGLGPHHLGLLFRAFEQADTNFARLRGGSGLGLAIGRHLARAMGGDLDVESELGRGSRFVFRWPVDVIERGAPCGWEGTALLLLDRSPAAREAFGAIAGVMGATAQTVSRTEEAIAAVRRSAPVCLVVGAPESGDAPGAAADLRAALGLACPPLVVAVPPGQVGLARAWVSSAVFDGSTLKPLRRGRLSAVLDELAGRAAAEPTSRPPAVRSTMRALVVDDDPTNRKVARLLLARHGWDVAEAASGDEALVMLAAGRFDVAFLDLHMPRMDGAELASLVRASLPQSEMPVLVALTASVFAADHGRAMQAGMQELLPKPIDRRSLASLVERLEGQRRSRAPATGSFASSLPPARDDRLAAAKIIAVESPALR